MVDLMLLIIVLISGVVIESLAHMVWIDIHNSGEPILPLFDKFNMWISQLMGYIWFSILYMRYGRE